MDGLAYRHSWGLTDFPPRVVLAGASFSRAFFAWPYEEIVAQYREERDRDAAHILVHADGTYSIHRDRTNPDRGPLLAMEHLWCDVPGGKVALLGGGVIIALTTGLVVRGMQKPPARSGNVSRGGRSRRRPARRARSTPRTRQR